MLWFVLLVTCTCAILGQGLEPKINIDAKDYDGFPENFNSLYVDTNRGTDFTFRWHHNGKLIDAKYKLPFLGQLSRVLTVNDPSKSKEYAGTYQFFMDTPVGSIAGRNVSVVFTYVGEFEDSKPTDLHNVTVVVGQAAFITCPKHKPGNNVIYKWGKTSGVGGTMFVDSSSNYIVLDNGTLFFSYLKESDMAYINDLNVKCGMEANVRKDNRFTWSRVVKMKNVSKNFTKFGPEVVTTLPVIKYTVGETIYLKCAAAGNPVPLYSWEVIDSEGNKKTIVNGQDNIFFADRDPRILEIKPIKKTHAGKYVCTATIGQKSDSTQGELIFEEQPSWIGVQIKSVRPSIYSNHSWQCNATGSPKPMYYWYRNGKELTDSSSHKISGGRISFPSLLEEDTGMYECVAHNRLNNIYQTAYLDVQAEKPRFDENKSNTTLFLNNQGTIKCYAYAAPTATNTWMKDGVIINTSLPQYKIINNQDLVIAQVSKSDTGEYTCTAENRYGKDTMKIWVEVIGEITFIRAPKDSNITQGNTLKLRCEAKGDESLVIRYKWRFNDKELTVGSNATVIWSYDSKTLVFIRAQAKQTGIYECIAYIDKPSYAEKKRRARVIIRGPPAEIDTVKVEGNCDNLEAKLTWSVIPTFDPILYYIMEWRTSYEMDEWHKHAERLPADRTEFLFKPLSPYAKYSFRILAVNQIDTSENTYHTEFRHCTTPARVPTKCPPPKAVAAGDGVLTIKWEKMKYIDFNGKNFNYLVQYKKTGESWRNKTLNAVAETFVVPNAGYYQRWEFQIRAVNEEGSGPACSNVAFSGQNAPNVPPAMFRATPSTNYVTLSWEPITLDPGNVDGYTLKYWQKPGSSTERRRSVNSNRCVKKKPCTEDIVGKTTFKVDDLASVQTYVMELWGYNSGGSGPNSSLEVTTNEGLPGPPGDVVFIFYARFIELRWKAPKKPNGIIVGYMVSQPLPKLFTRQVGAEVMRYVFTGLEPDKIYTVSVHALTKQGLGEPVTLTGKTKKDAAPAQPQPPLVKGTGKDGVNVTFREGTPTRGFPETFFVIYRVEGQEDGEVKKTKPQSLVGDKSRRTIVIPGLDVKTKYEFATIASNYFNDSAASGYNGTYPGEGGVTPVARSSPIYKRSWFVALIVIVCILLIFLIIALLVTRKHGERYPVGKRERRRAGILNNAEEAEPDTYPMKPNRNAGNGTNRNGSKISLPKDHDRDSLDEYGEDRFGEDAGSLIGEYNDDTKKPSTVEGPEFV